MSTPKSSTKNGLDVQLTPDEGEVALALSSCLTDLIAQYDQAEAKFIHASKRSYTPEFKSLLANAQLTDRVRHVLVQQREDATGFDGEVEGRSAFAYAQVLALADEIIRLKYTSPAVLALKARACLWERSPENMHGDGGVRAAHKKQARHQLVDRPLAHTGTLRGMWPVLGAALRPNRNSGFVQNPDIRPRDRAPPSGTMRPHELVGLSHPP